MDKLVPGDKVRVFIDAEVIDHDDESNEVTVQYSTDLGAYEVVLATDSPAFNIATESTAK